ncbi:hypothetical protein CEV34_5601 [Brucella pseudogrignonensis]|jgi:hypothetical protein|uniref:Uncharacterized protein n=1 Tax=Brucella pseudogrignonensis TaxID=419475 RepID=A0A256G0G6_9HYPH|nr:hypothetical protein CEV34_5601 [Brucella pseudogrignonensis]
MFHPALAACQNEISSWHQQFVAMQISYYSNSQYPTSFNDDVSDAYSIECRSD